jgi:hypothetical protein
VTARVFYKGNSNMVTKLVVGLTDSLHSEFIINLEKAQMHYDSQAVSVDAYVIPTSISITENETLEWILDTTLPGVTSLLSTVEQMKTRLLLREATIIKRMPIDGYNSFSLLFGLINYVPNPAVVYTEFTDEDYNSLVVYHRFGDLVLEEVDGYEINSVPHTSSITYAIDHDTTDYLSNAYPPRSAVPMFNVRFTIGERDNIPQHNMPLEFDEWFNTNIDALTAKGWEITNPKSRAGFYVAGSLVGDRWEQYLKLSNNPYICSIDVVEV